MAKIEWDFDAQDKDRIEISVVYPSPWILALDLVRRGALSYFARVDAEENLSLQLQTPPITHLPEQAVIEGARGIKAWAVLTEGTQQERRAIFDASQQNLTEVTS